MKISKDKRANIRNMLVRMSKKVYKEMVKDMDKIASQEEPSQQQCASNVICNHWIFQSLGAINKQFSIKLIFKYFLAEKQRKWNPFST